MLIRGVSFYKSFKKLIYVLLVLSLLINQNLFNSNLAHADDIILAQQISLNSGEQQTLKFTAPLSGILQVSTLGSNQFVREYEIINSFGVSEKSGSQSGGFDAVNVNLVHPGGMYSLKVYFLDSNVTGSFTVTIRSFNPTLPALTPDTPNLITIDNPGEYRIAPFTAPASGIVQVITQAGSTNDTRDYEIIDSSGIAEKSGQLYNAYGVDNITLVHPGGVYSIKLNFDYIPTTGSFTVTIRSFNPTLPALTPDTPNLITIDNPGEYRIASFTAPASGVIQVITQASSTDSDRDYEIINSFGVPEKVGSQFGASASDSVTLARPGKVYSIKLNFRFSSVTGSFAINIAGSSQPTPAASSPAQPTPAVSSQPQPAPTLKPTRTPLPIVTKNPSKVPTKKAVPKPLDATGALISPSDLTLNHWIQALPASDLLAGICNNKVCTATAVPKIAVIGHDPDSGAVLPVIAFPAVSNITNLYSKFDLYVYEYKDSKLSWQASQQNLIPKNVTRGNAPSLTSFFHYFKKGKDGVEVIWDIHNTYRAILTAHDLNGKTVILASAEDSNTTVNTACQWGQLGLFVLKDGIKVAPQLVSVSASTISDVAAGLSSKITDTVINQLPIPAPLKNFTKAEQKEILHTMFKESLSEVQWISLAADLADTAINVRQAYLDGKINGEGVLGIAATITHVGAAKLLGDSQFSKSSKFFINPGTKKFLSFVGLTQDIEGMYQVAATMNNLVQDADKTINMKCVNG